PAKLTQFKMSPQSNYREIAPKLRETVIAQKMDEKVRAKLTPSNAQLREEWGKRSEQVRFKFLPLTLRDVSLDPEASESEQLAYYNTHTSEFERKASIALKYVSLALPGPADSLRKSEEKRLQALARSLKDSLERGTPFDTLAARHGGALETGPF